MQQCQKSKHLTEQLTNLCLKWILGDLPHPPWPCPHLWGQDLHSNRWLCLYCLQCHKGKILDIRRTWCFSNYWKEKVFSIFASGGGFVNDGGTKLKFFCITPSRYLLTTETSHNCDKLITDCHSGKSAVRSNLKLHENYCFFPTWLSLMMEKYFSSSSSW